MGAILGEGDFRYEHVLDWHKLPEGARLIETPGVAVDSQDDVYAFSRNPDFPVMVFNQDGDFVRGFGRGHLRGPHSRHLRRSRGHHLLRR